MKVMCFDGITRKLEDLSILVADAIRTFGGDRTTHFVYHGHSLMEHLSFSEQGVREDNLLYFVKTPRQVPLLPQVDTIEYGAPGEIWIWCPCEQHDNRDPNLPPSLQRGYIVKRCTVCNTEGVCSCNAPFLRKYLCSGIRKGELCAYEGRFIPGVTSSSIRFHGCEHKLPIKDLPLYISRRYIVECKGKYHIRCPRGCEGYASCDTILAGGEILRDRLSSWRWIERELDWGHSFCEECERPSREGCKHPQFSNLHRDVELHRDNLRILNALYRRSPKSTLEACHSLGIPLYDIINFSFY